MFEDKSFYMSEYAQYFTNEFGIYTKKFIDH